MRFKVVGIVLLVIGAWLALEGVISARKENTDAISATTYPLVAVFLAMVVRVLQAEKHHRDRLKIEEAQELDAVESMQASHAHIAREEALRH